MLSDYYGEVLLRIQGVQKEVKDTIVLASYLMTCKTPVVQLPHLFIGDSSDIQNATNILYFNIMFRNLAKYKKQSSSIINHIQLNSSSSTSTSNFKAKPQQHITVNFSRNNLSTPPKEA